MTVKQQPPPRSKKPQYENCDASPEPAKTADTSRHNKSQNMAKDEVLGKAVRLRKLRDDAKQAEAQAKEIASEMVPLVKKYGEKTSQTTTTMEFPLCTVLLIEAEQQVFNEERVMKTLQELTNKTGIDYVEKATKRVLDGDALTALFQQGIIDANKLDSLTDKKQMAPSIRVNPK